MTAILRERSAEDSAIAAISSDSEVHFCAPEGIASLIGNAVIVVSAVLTFGKFGSNFGNGIGEMFARFAKG